MRGRWRRKAARWLPALEAVSGVAQTVSTDVPNSGPPLICSKSVRASGARARAIRAPYHVRVCVRRSRCASGGVAGLRLGRGGQPPGPGHSKFGTPKEHLYLSVYLSIYLSIGNQWATPGQVCAPGSRPLTRNLKCSELGTLVLRWGERAGGRRPGMGQGTRAGPGGEGGKEYSVGQRQV